MGWQMEDERFPQALEWRRAGWRLLFVVEPLRGADHPNALAMRLTSAARANAVAAAQSTGGGTLIFTELEAGRCA